MDNEKKKKEILDSAKRDGLSTGAVEALSKAMNGVEKLLDTIPMEHRIPTTEYGLEFAQLLFRYVPRCGPKNITAMTMIFMEHFKDLSLEELR